MPSRALPLGADGEFDLDFFFSLLKMAQPAEGETFCDLGSGCARLVVAAALAGYPWREAVGVELLDDLHALAEGSLATLQPIAAASDEIELRPCRLLAGDAGELIPQLVREDGGASKWVLFSYTTCMPSVGPYLCELSALLGAALPVGSRVIVCDKTLVSDDHGRWAFRLLGQLDAPNYNTHSSTGYVYELEAKRAVGAEPGAGAGGGRLRPSQFPMVSRRAVLLNAALLASPLAVARQARAAAEPQQLQQPQPAAAGAALDAARDISFSGRALGLGLADVQTPAGSRVAVSRVLAGSEAERNRLVAGYFLTAVMGQKLRPGTHADDVRKLLSGAPRPVVLTFQGALAPDLSVELAAKAKGAETERFQIERTKEPAPNCGIRSRKGDTIEIEYEARLTDPTGRLIDSSFSRGIGAPFALQLGNGDVPRALELGIYDMCIAEARRIVAPPRLAYGMGGNRALGVPPNATIVWDVSMAAINFQTDPATKREDTGMALTPWEASPWEKQSLPE